MEERQTRHDTAPQAVIESYLDAVREQDLPRCVDAYTDDAAIHFMGGVFKGKQAIEEWHQERFNAEFEFVRINKITADGDKVTLDAVITTKKLRAWKIRKLAGKAVFHLHQGKIREVKFSPRMYNPFEGW